MTAPIYERKALWVNGENFHYHVPGMVRVHDGTLLAYCEKRTVNHDQCPKDLVMKRSTDNGVSWSPEEILANGTDASICYNNPVMIAENNTDTVHLFYTRDGVQTFYRRSRDGGHTWEASEEITYVFDQYRTSGEYQWAYHLTGPGHGIQLRNGTLLVPVWMSTGTIYIDRPNRTASIYSTDGGRTWKRGELISLPEGVNVEGTNETAAVELDNGQVYFNLRVRSDSRKRAGAVSPTGYSGWEGAVLDDKLNDPICQGSLVKYNDGMILFSNIDQTAVRNGLTVRLSTDNCKTWTFSKVLEAGKSGYSDMAVSGTDIFCLHQGKHGGVEGLILDRFNIEWVTGQ